MGHKKRALHLLSVCVISNYLVGPVYSGSYQVSTGAVYYESGFETIEKIVDNSETSSTIGFDETANIVFASSILATGQAKVTAVSNQGAGRAGWMDDIELTIAGLDSASIETIVIHLVMDGTYAAPDGQATLGFYALSGLNTNGNVDFLQAGVSVYDFTKDFGRNNCLEL
jgi:hypothetical protein